MPNIAFTHQRGLLATVLISAALIALKWFDIEQRVASLTIITLALAAILQIFVREPIWRVKLHVVPASLFFAQLLSHGWLYFLSAFVFGFGHLMDSLLDPSENRDASVAFSLAVIPPAVVSWALVRIPLARFARRKQGDIEE